MATEYEYKCKKCGKEHQVTLGMGEDFPEVYRKVVEAMKNGIYGEEAKTFFAEHADGVINAEQVILQCDDCKHISDGPALTLYVPKEEVEDDLPPAPERDYVIMPNDRYLYDRVGEVHYTCPKCGGKMIKYNDREFFKLLMSVGLPCPDCDGKLQIMRQLVPTNTIEKDFYYE